MTEFVFTSSHEVYYSNREPVPVSEIAESLLAIERIAQQSRFALSQLTGIAIQRVDVYVESITSGSLQDHILLKMFFKDEAELDAFLDKVREKIRQPGMTRNVLIGAVLAALVGYGLYLAAKGSGVPSTTTITANNNVIINVGADQMGLDPEKFKAILEAAIHDKKDLAKSAVKLLKPARSDSKAQIRIDGTDALTFSPAVIAETPVKVEFETQSDSIDLLDVDLQIRATNRDSLTQGWAGLVPGQVNKRVRLVLDPSIKPDDVAKRFRLRADVTVMKKLNPRGNIMVPDYIILRKIVEE